MSGRINEQQLVIQALHVPNERGAQENKIFNLDPFEEDLFYFSCLLFWIPDLHDIHSCLKSRIIQSLTRSGTWWSNSLADFQIFSPKYLFHKTVPSPRMIYPLSKMNFPALMTKIGLFSSIFPTQQAWSKEGLPSRNHLHHHQRNSKIIFGNEAHSLQEWVPTNFQCAHGSVPRTHPLVCTSTNLR